MRVKLCTAGISDLSIVQNQKINQNCRLSNIPITHRSITVQLCTMS